MEKIIKKKIKTIAIEILEIIIGAIIMALATSLFLLPNQLSTGGLTGIATIVYYFLKIPMGTTILVLNIPLFLLAIYRLGKNFAFRSIIGTIAYSISLNITEKIEPITQDGFLACIYGGVLIGLGTAIILKGNGSTGGSDLVSSVIKTYKPDIKMGYIITIIDTMVVLFNVLFFREIEIGLYSAIAIYLMGKVIDIVFEGVNFTKLLIIISNKKNKVNYFWTIISSFVNYT